MAECRTGLSCSQANQDMKREEPGEMMGIETAALMHPQGPGRHCITIPFNAGGELRGIVRSGGVSAFSCSGPTASYYSARRAEGSQVDPGRTLVGEPGWQNLKSGKWWGFAAAAAAAAVPVAVVLAAVAVVPGAPPPNRDLTDLDFQFLPRASGWQA